MIDIPERWEPRWRSTAQSRCVCWEIVRKDGVSFLFTSWDKPIFIGPKKFLPCDDDASGGGQVTGATHQGSLKEHSAGLAGVLSSSSISEDDLRAGLFQDATVYTYMLDAAAPSAGYIRRTFRVADTRWTTDGSWEFGVVSAIDSALQQKVGEIVSRTCRNTLFGARCARERNAGAADGLVGDEWEIGQTSGNFCTVSSVINAYTLRVQIPAATIAAIGTSTGDDQTTFTFTGNHYFCGLTPAGGRSLRVPLLVYGNVGSVPDVNGEWETVITAPGAPDTSITILGVDASAAGSTKGFACLAPVADWFARGKLTWASGDNAGQVSRIVSSTAFTASPTSGFGGYVDIGLDSALPMPASVGDTCTLRVGCDLSSTMCRDRFDNIVNFNGEPFTPTADVLLNTPSAN